MRAEKKFITRSEKETFNLGKNFAAKLNGGEVLALSGNLGAGKTIFAKGLAAGLGVKEIITSPTFVIMKVYFLPKAENKIKNFVHIDCYRVSEPEAIEAIGAKEYFNRQDSIVLIEWAERIKKILPEKFIKIKISIVKNNQREIIIK